MTDVLAFWIRDFSDRWLDFLWVPIAFLTVHKGQRIKAVAFVLLTGTVLRLQMGIMERTGFTNGFTGWVKMPLYHRGLIVYGIFTALYLILSRLSPGTTGIIYLAATLSIFFMAFLVSSIVMIL